jgi:hypothetical protein
MAAARSCGLDPRVDDLGAVARVVEGIARAAADLRGGLASLEANPLIVGSRGAVAVDALARSGLRREHLVAGTSGQFCRWR